MRDRIAKPARLHCGGVARIQARNPGLGRREIRTRMGEGFAEFEWYFETPDGKREMATVFVPTNNLYLGDVIVLPREDIITTGLTVEEGIRIILSAGTATPARLPRDRMGSVRGTGGPAA